MLVDRRLKPLRAAFACLLLLCVSSASVRADNLAAPSFQAADKVLVVKSERRLFLLRGKDVLRSYRVSLGLNPVGHKQRNGDFRTPEGLYRLTRRNSRSEFFLSIKVSYPNAADAAFARRNGWDAGGQIMIHGFPNNPRHAPEHYASNDWTNGCIALSNADMLEVWSLVDHNTIIEIKP
jgi:murein L,D-transpeptidase YafK